MKPRWSGTLLLWVATFRITTGIVHVLRTFVTMFRSTQDRPWGSSGSTVPWNLGSRTVFRRAWGLMCYVGSKRSEPLSTIVSGFHTYRISYVLGIPNGLVRHHFPIERTFPPRPVFLVHCRILVVTGVHAYIDTTR